MRQYKSPDDELRPGQRIIDYAYLKNKVKPRTSRPDPLETWLWNLSEEEFKKVMEWSPEK